MLHRFSLLLKYVVPKIVVQASERHSFWSKWRQLNVFITSYFYVVLFVCY